MERVKLDKIVLLFFDCIKMIKYQVNFPISLILVGNLMVVYHIKFIWRDAWTMGFIGIRKFVLMKNSSKAHVKILGVLAKLFDVISQADCWFYFNL